MAERRRDPYIWPTWLTKLMSGEAQCGFAPWFKAHFQGYEKRKETAEDEERLNNWKARHQEMLRIRAEELAKDGYQVFLEDQNKFTLRGRVGTLQGKPDIVAINGDDYLVSDAKGGKPRTSDQMQVFIYMFALPLTHAACRGKAVRGELFYSDGPVEIDVLPTKIRELIVATIGRVAGPEALSKVPSYSECRFCDLTKADCKERIDQESEATKTDLW